MSGLRRRGNWTMEGLAAPAVATASAVAAAVAFAVIPANAGIQFAAAFIPSESHKDEQEHLDPGVRRDDGQKPLDSGLTSHPAVESRRNDEQKRQRNRKHVEHADGEAP